MDIKQQQVVYHDWESAHYETKWSISFDQRCVDYVRGRFLLAVPEGRRFPRVLEVGSGTGFFLLNLAQAGFVGEAHCTDISAAMVARCVENGRRQGIVVHGRVADAEQLPYADGSFDLVVGHAVLHHLPDVPSALREFRRVLRPGGRLVIAGEPSQLGDLVANCVKQQARIAVKLAAVVAGRDRVLANPWEELGADDLAAAALETQVDLHTFDPEDLHAETAEAGFVDVAVHTEELVANWFGWATRTVEAMVKPEVVPARYPWVAYRIWQALFALDNRVLRRVVPPEYFYNCVVTGRAPHVVLVRGGR